jgi:predicted CopG family antitoxin
LRERQLTENFYIVIVIVITMATTIQIREPTLQVLKKIKAELGLKTYDEVINRLIKRRRSMFGAHPGITEFKEEDEAEFHEV